MSEDGRSLSGRIEENFKIARGALVSRTFYEIGSGLERKMEFSYKDRDEYVFSDPETYEKPLQQALDKELAYGLTRSICLIKSLMSLSLLISGFTQIISGYSGREPITSQVFKTG